MRGLPPTPWMCMSVTRVKTQNKIHLSGRRNHSMGAAITIMNRLLSYTTTHRRRRRQSSSIKSRDITVLSLLSLVCTASASLWGRRHLIAQQHQLMHLSRSSTRYDTHPIINYGWLVQSSSTADVATTDYSVLHRLRGGDGTDESSSSSTTTASPSPEEDVDNSGNNSDVVSVVNTSEPVVDISMVETNNEVADDASVDVNADVEEESGQEDDDSLEEVDEHQVGDDDVNNNSIDEIATEETIIITDANEIQFVKNISNS